MTPEQEKMRRQLAALASFEQGGGDIAGLALDDVRDPGGASEPLPSSPERPPLFAPKVVDLTAQPKGDLEVEAARSSDTDAANARARELAYRQLVAGITRTEAPAPITQLGTAEKDLKAKRQQQQLDRLRELELGNAAKRIDFDQRESARKAAVEEQRRQEDLAERAKDNERSDRGIRSRDAHTAVLERIALQGATIAKTEAEAKKTEREEKRAASVIPLVGGTFAMKPGLSDSDRSKARDYASSWNTAIGAVDGVQSALGEYLREPSMTKKGDVEAQLVGALTALNVAYKQGAMADTEARRLSAAMGVDLTSATGLAAAVSSWLAGDPGKAGAILQGKVRTLREASRRAALNSMSAYGDFTEGRGAAAAGGRVIVSNGKETVEIDAADLADAERDGFKAVR